jgi:hypothetical protein
MTDPVSHGFGGKMSMFSLIIDGYERKARLYPALLLLMPIAMIALAASATKLSVLEGLGGAAVGCGGAFFLSQFARDAGKKGEKALFEKWGGMPSVAVFRHRDIRIDPITKARYHKRLADLVKGAKAPSANDEQEDPVAADGVYSAWSTYLRVNTRDTKKYSLLLQENINYGYRRNVWGLRHIGITITALCCIGSALWLYIQFRLTGRIMEEMVLAFGVTFLLLILWVFQFSSNWVRIPADAYAERLAETVETFGGKTSGGKQ